MSKTTPTQRSLAHLRKQGYTVGIVEHFNPHVGPHGIRQDFCGGIDLIAFRAALGHHTFLARSDLPGGGCEVHGENHHRLSGQILGVQCCSGNTGGSPAAHRRKLLAEPRMREWIAAGGRLVLHSWAKRGERGRRKLWTLKEEELRLIDFETPSGPVHSAG